MTRTTTADPASWEYVTITRDAHPRVAVVTFDRKDGKNPLSRQAMRELMAAAHSFEEDTETSAVVLTGTSSVFTVGADLKDPTRVEDRTAGLAVRRHNAAIGGRLCKAWQEINPLTLVALEGWCIGGGAALAISCDLRVAGAGARFSIPEIQRGMNLNWNAVPRLVNLVGPARAKRMCILAEHVGAEAAHGMGLVDELAAEGGALDAALKLARMAGDMPPVPVRMIKRDCDVAATALNYAVSSMDYDQFTLATYGEDYEEGVQSFLEKRPPRYTGR